MTLPAAIANGDGRFDIEAARFLARLSRAAYGSPEDFGKALPEIPDNAVTIGYITNRLDVHGYDTQAYFLDFGSARVLAFRGTERNHWDILTDLKIRKRELAGTENGGRVHRGFQAALDAVWPRIVEALGDRSTPVYVTGHSLGGALAVLAARRIANATAYTFGAPRVGDKAFAKFAGPLGHYRVDNGIDIVPKLPLLLMGYRHTGRWYYIASGGGLWVGHGRIAAIGDMAVSVARDIVTRDGWRRWLPVGMLRAHRISEYERRLAALK